MAQLQGNRASLGATIFHANSPSYFTQVLKGPRESSGRPGVVAKINSEMKVAWQSGSIEKPAGGRVTSDQATIFD